MQLTDLGFLFLLLPVSVAVYYCVPNRKKPLALLIISVFFLFLIDRRSFVVVGSSVLLDCLVLNGKKAETSAFGLLDFCIAKHAVLLILFGLLLPLLGGITPMVGTVILSLSAIDLLVDIRRGMPVPSGVDYAAAVLFFGRIPFGPAGQGKQLLSMLRSPVSSLSGIGRGTMLLISGVAKQVILSGEFIALFRTLSHLSSDRMALATGWLYALCCALGLYFVASGFSDIAQGLGLIFSLSLPRTVYYPLQAPRLREYLYRFNMPLEDTLYHLFLPQLRREAPGLKPFLVSALMPLLLGFFFDPSGSFLPWGLLLSGLLLLDGALLRHLPVVSPLLARVVTFLLTLPAYLLLLPVGLEQRFTLLGTMFGIGGPQLVNQTTFYLLRSNLALLLIGILFCSSLFDRLGRLTERQFPQLWWIASAAGHLALLVIATSFLLWNVR